MKKLFISQPMRDKTDEEIKAERTKIVKVAAERFGEVEVIDSFFESAPHDARPLWFLGKSLELLSTADIVYFADGWKDYRGCKLEHECAVQYGIEIVEGEVKDLDIQTFTFGEAIRRLKAGQKVARKGWNGKGMFIYLTSGSKVPAVSMKPETANHLFGEKLLECDKTVTINPHIDMKASDGTVVIGWLASQTDMLATDWIVAE